MRKLIIGLVEDNAQLGQDIREKLALSEDVLVIWEVRDGKSLLATLAEGRLPDVILMDIGLPEMDGIEATRQVKQCHPNQKIIMLTVMDDEQKLFEALQAGASGYLLKDVKPHRLLNAIEEVMEGGLPLSPTLASRVLNYLKNGKTISRTPDAESQPGNPELTIKPILPAKDGLTKQEQIVLECLQQGMTVRQIAERLFRADSTVRKHLEHIYEKLQVHSGKEAIVKRLGRK
jgi:DNA-binding NarL/FixJ family response regulator